MHGSFVVERVERKVNILRQSSRLGGGKDLEGLDVEFQGEQRRVTRNEKRKNAANFVTSTRAVLCGMGPIRLPSCGHLQVLERPAIAKQLRPVNGRNCKP
jgi:hypothetical protein